MSGGRIDVPIQIAFVRSGGFAAVPGLQASGTVTIDGSQAFVSGQASYHRDLKPDERQLLADCAAALVEHGSVEASAADKAARDAYRFRFTIDVDGRSRVVEGSSATAGQTDPLGRLVNWAEDESAAILRARPSSH
jgi:hypothetical protein